MEVKTNNYKCIHTLSIKIKNFIFIKRKEVILMILVNCKYPQNSRSYKFCVG